MFYWDEPGAPIEPGDRLGTSENLSSSFFWPFLPSAKIYAVLDDPQWPMDPVWSSLLDYSCAWAFGTDTDTEVAAEATRGLFFQRPGLAYPINTQTYWVFNVAPGSGQLHLKSVLAAMEHWAPGNCLDVSAVLCVAINSLGTSADTRQLALNQLASQVFRSNPICLIGSDPTGPNYQEMEWNWHSIVVRSEYAYDACGASFFDLLGAAYQNPPAHEAAHAWHVTGYWQTQGSNATLGLVQLPNPTPSGPARFSAGFPSLDWRPAVTTAPTPLEE